MQKLSVTVLHVPARRVSARLSGEPVCPDQATLAGPWDRLGKKRKVTSGGGCDGREP